MNLKKLTDKQLLELINTTNDTETLVYAEEEYLFRVGADEAGLLEEFDELTDYEREFINKHWRPS